MNEYLKYEILNASSLGIVFEDTYDVVLLKLVLSDTASTWHLIVNYTRCENMVHNGF